MTLPAATKTRPPNLRPRFLTQSAFIPKRPRYIEESVLFYTKHECPTIKVVGRSTAASAPTASFAPLFALAASIERSAEQP